MTCSTNRANPKAGSTEGYFGGEEKDSIFFRPKQTLTEHPAGVRIEHGRGCGPAAIGPMVAARRGRNAHLRARP